MTIAAGSLIRPLFLRAVLTPSEASLQSEADGCADRDK